MSRWKLAAGHACVDVYQGAVAALVPFFVAERAWSYAAVSGLVLAASLSSSVTQPLFGLLTDRFAMPWLLPVSTILAGLGVGLSGRTGSYTATWLCIGLTGIGVAAYHPESARLARVVSRGSHTAMAWFTLGGNVGFALAPILVAAVAMNGLHLTPLLIAPALTGALLCLPLMRTTPNLADQRPRARPGSVGNLPEASPSSVDGHSGASPGTAGGSPGASPDSAGGCPGVSPDATGNRSEAPHDPAHLDRLTGSENVRSFLILSFAVICRSIVFVGLSAYIALHAQQRNANGSAALFLLYLGGAVGTLVGGHLAERRPRVTVIRWSYLLIAPALAGILLTEGPALLLCTALASITLYIPFSLQTTLGQDYLPSRPGTASGVTLGLTVTAGGLAAPLLGALADVTSLRTALLPLLAFPVLAWLLARHLPEPGRTPTRAAASP